VQVEPEIEELSVEGNRRVDVGDNVTDACVIYGSPPMNAIRPALPVASGQHVGTRHAKPAWPMSSSTLARAETGKHHHPVGFPIARIRANVGRHGGHLLPFACAGWIGLCQRLTSSINPSRQSGCNRSYFPRHEGGSWWSIARLRILAVPKLLQAHGRMIGADLARRLEVDVRTVEKGRGWGAPTPSPGTPPPGSSLRHISAPSRRRRGPPGGRRGPRCAARRASAS
jgi:hypothetical protein